MESKNTFLNFFTIWFKTIDLLNLTLIFFLILLGILFVTTSSPSIAKLKGLEDFYFIKKQITFSVISIGLLVLFSMFSLRGITFISLIGCMFFMFLTILTLIIGQSYNGASRWIKIYSFSLQPTEFLKPFLIIIFSYLLAKKEINLFKLVKMRTVIIAFSLLLITSIMLLLQPNFSMIAIIFLVFLSQFFLSPHNYKWIFLFLTSLTVFITVAYTNMSHVKYRIDNYINISKPHYQIEKSILAYQKGGVLGKGPGEGNIKKYIPDAHTDFIFPVIAEEYGGSACLAIIIIIFTIFFRGLFMASKSMNVSSIIAVCGLLNLFIVQALINIGVSMKLIPTTGITLPFISYGGSSLISMSISMGIVLSLTRRKYGGQYKF